MIVKFFRIAARLIARMGVAAPFTRSFAGAGVQVKAQATMPFTIKAKYGDHLSISVKPSAELAKNASPKVKFQVTPFTVINSWTDSEPLVKSIKPIQTKSQPRQFEHDLSSYALGL